MAKGPGVCASELDKWITIQRVTETRSTSGAPIETWATLARVRAKVMFERGYEQTEGPGEQARVQQRFRIRWKSGLTNKDRISYEPDYADAAQIYDITSIQEIERRKWMEIQARARVA